MTATNLQNLQNLILSLVPVQPPHPPALHVSSFHVRHYLREQHGIVMSVSDVVATARQIPDLIVTHDDDDDPDEFCWLQRKQ